MAELSVHSAGKSFGGKTVLRDNDLEVRPGEIVALLGPSGCGKTTLLRLIAGFERLDAGEIAIDGALVGSPHVHLPPEQRRVGYVPQEGALFPHLTVAQNILFGLPRRERRIEAVDELVEMTRLRPLLERYPHQLSGGQQQRVALARALAPRPALIVLDEPFNALDLDLRRRVVEEVVALLHGAGTSTLLVTHDPDEAFAAADRLAVMVDGRIAQLDRPETVYRAPADPAVAAVTGPVILIDGIAAGGRAETPLGTLPLRTRPADGPVRVALRPEQIALSREGAGVKARIVERRFRGAHLLLTVATETGQQLGLTIAADFDWAPGDTGSLTIRGAVAAFPA